MMRFSRVTSAFVLAAAIAVVFNTALACAKDAYKPLNDYMARLSGHQWKTHGLADLILFVALGVLFMNLRAVEKIDANRLIQLLVGCSIVAGVGLGVWYLVY